MPMSSIVRHTAAPNKSRMKLTETERERITDSVLKIQSVRASLEHVEKSKIPNQEKIDECLKHIDESFRAALGYRRTGNRAPFKAPERS